jgi:NAD(P)-dependent dehydrogenase (short-subunit alcohol dehydrogenase family)
MKKILITGGTGLLGKEIVKGFLNKKCRVYFTSTTKKKSDEFLKSINSKLRKNCIPIIHKFHDYKDISNFIKKYNKLKFDTLINNARSISNLNLNVNNEELFNSFNQEIYLAVNLPYFLSMNLNHKYLKYIVNISSMYGVVPPNKNLYKDNYKSSPIYYGVSKAAEIHLTKELAVRFADKKIRVNSLSFGGFEGRVDKSFKKLYAKMCPLGRMLKPKEVFEPIWFLCSEQSSGATGHNLIIDGGWTTW